MTKGVEKKIIEAIIQPSTGLTLEKIRAAKKILDEQPVFTIDWRYMYWNGNFFRFKSNAKMQVADDDKYRDLLPEEIKELLPESVWKD